MNEQQNQNSAAGGQSALSSLVMCGSIPLRDGEPAISNKMKAACIGEFEIEIDEICTACHFDAPDNDCEVCGGQVEYERTVTVPWDVMKAIYKRMASIAMEDSPHNGQG